MGSVGAPNLVNEAMRQLAHWLTMGNLAPNC